MRNHRSYLGEPASALAGRRPCNSSLDAVGSSGRAGNDGTMENRKEMKKMEETTAKATPEAAAKRAENETTNWRDKLYELVKALVMVIFIAVVINAFGVQAFKIPSGSMLPTLQIGDYLLVNRFIYGLRLPSFVYGLRLPLPSKLLVPVSTPKRGDVIVFRFPKDPKTDFIKRVVGLPGDTVEVRDKVVYINGEKIADPHAHFTDGMTPDISRGPRDEFGPVLVPKDHLFVMGDNRDNSYDSRFWRFVPEENVLGKAFIIYWSWDLEKSLASLERWRSIRWNRMFDLID